MKIAITGASGKTGYRIVEEAEKKGLKVKQIVRKNSKTIEDSKKRETNHNRTTIKLKRPHVHHYKKQAQE